MTLVTSAKERIVSPNGPAAIGPYSAAVRTGNLLFCSGQMPIDPATGDVVVGTIADETRRTLDNLVLLLASAGVTTAEVVKTTVFLADMADFADMNAVYAEYFSEPFPARSTVAVAGIAKGARVEIEAVAVLPE